MMQKKMRQTACLTIFVFCLAFGGIPAVLGATQTTSSTFAIQATPFYRTELYFGRSIPGGGMFSDAEWEKFLLDVVTYRFPTVLRFSMPAASISRLITT
jgi:hypothetical protein